MPSFEFDHVYRGKPYRCACEVDGSSVTVSVLGKRKRTNLEGMDPHRIARILAHEILIEADHRREL